MVLRPVYFNEELATVAVYSSSPDSATVLKSGNKIETSTGNLKINLPAGKSFTGFPCYIYDGGYNVLGKYNPTKGTNQFLITSWNPTSDVLILDIDAAAESDKYYFKDYTSNNTFTPSVVPKTTTVPVNVTVTAPDGYLFTKDGWYVNTTSLDTPRKRVTLKANNQNTITVSIDPRFYTKNYFDDNYGNIIHIVPTMASAVITYTETGGKYKSNLTGQTTISAGQHQLTITVDDGYQLKANGYYSIDGNKTVINSNPITTSSYDFTLTVPATAKTVEVHFDYDTLNYPIELNLANCTIEPNITSIQDGTSQDFTITANPGYSLDGGGTLVQSGTYGDQTTDLIATNDVIKFTLSPKKTSRIFKYIVTVTAIKSASNVNLFNYIYLIDKDKLNNLAKERILEQTSGSTFDIYDFGRFITSLYKLPFKVPADLIDEPTAIQLGTKVATTKASTINSYRMKVDIGTISVAEKYHSSFDYLNTTAKLYLPFIQPIDIKPTECIGKKVHIIYDINLYTSLTTISIFSDDRLIYTLQEQIGTHIPFIQFDNNSAQNDIAERFSNGVLTAYIELTRQKPIINPKGYKTLEKGKLVDYNGITTASDIELNGNENYQEIQEIKNLLNKGVDIK